MTVTCVNCGVKADNHLFCQACGKNPLHKSVQEGMLHVEEKRFEELPLKYQDVSNNFKDLLSNTHRHKLYEAIDFQIKYSHRSLHQYWLELARIICHELMYLNFDTRNERSVKLAAEILKTIIKFDSVKK
jgi:hypothetical protein